MQWSKLRLRLRDLLAPDLSRRVDYQLTNYRAHSEYAHEVWITVDKNRIFSASCRAHMKAMNEMWYQNQWADRAGEMKMKELLVKREVHDACDVVSSFRAYLDLDPQIAFTSTNPIIRGLVVVDRRIGRRTLEAIKLVDDEHSLIRTLHSLRLSVMKMTVQ